MRVAGIALVAIDALGIFAARHLEAVGRAGELHPLHWSAPGTFLSITERPPNRLAEPGRICSAVTPPLASARREARVLRPDAMLGPDFGPRRAGRLIAVAVRLAPGRGIVAEVAVDVDDARRHIFAAPRRSRSRPPGAASVGPPTAWTTPSASTTDAIVDPPALAVEDGRAADHRRRARIALIGRRIGILVDPDRARLGLRRGAAQAGKARDGTGLPPRA